MLIINNVRMLIMFYLDECKYVVKKARMQNLISDDLDLISSDEFDNEIDNETDNESDSETDN